MPQFVIAYKKSATDGSLGGFAVNDPHDGWTYTALLSHATKFSTREEAEKVRTVAWPYRGDRDYVVKEVG